MKEYLLLDTECIVRLESRCALRLQYSTVRRSGYQYQSFHLSVLLLHCIQRLKGNTGKVCNCLIQFLLAVVLSIEERAFIVEYVLQEGNRYTNLEQQQFAEKFPEAPVPHHNAVHRLIE
jgi:hypothetical protein